MTIASNSLTHKEAEKLCRVAIESMFAAVHPYVAKDAYVSQGHWHVTFIAFRNGAPVGTEARYPPSTLGQEIEAAILAVRSQFPDRATSALMWRTPPQMQESEGGWNLYLRCHSVPMWWMGVEFTDETAG